ncbi:MAG: hypothetical protein JWQ24_339 [Tardiphaga sp.]|nr:hypothetical protein [Tardiphaga sp.]
MNGLGLDLGFWNGSVLQGASVPALLIRRPLSFVKAIPNEYNGGAGLGAGNTAVGGTCHYPIYDDVTDGSFEVRFWHGAATAAQGEWNTGGTMTVACSLIWVDNSGALQITVLNGAGSVPSCDPFQETVHRHPGVRGKVGSHAWLNYSASFTNSGYYSHGRADYAQGEALQYGASVPNLVGSATFYGNTWNGGGDFWGPSFFGWSGGTLTRPTFGISGDSNHSDLLTTSSVQADIPDTLQGAPGAVNRLFVPNMAGIDVSIPGAYSSEAADPSKYVYRDRMLKGRCDVFVPALGTNGIIFQGRTEAQEEADIAAYIARLGFSQVFVPTIPPVVTSAASNTILNSGNGRDVIRRARNTTLRGRSNTIDIAMGTESGVAPGTLQFLADTIEGTHFNATGNKRAAAGTGFDVPTKIAGASAVDVGYRYPSGALYQSLGLSGWSTQQSVLTANQAYSPEHKITASIIKEDATAAAQHNAYVQQTIALASTTKKITAFVKRQVGSRNAQIQAQQNGGSYLSSRVWVNLGTGVVTLVEQSAGTVSGMTSTLTADGFWKVEFNVAFSAGHPASSLLYVKLADATGSDTFNGDNTSSIAVWGFDIR